MENPLKNLVKIIKTGQPQEVKEAQKKVKEFWRKVYVPKRKKSKKAFLIFLEEIKKFEKIKDLDHQVYLINTLKWPLWVIGEEYFEKWAEFILKYIQHPSGKIRQAIVKAADYLIMDIMPDLRSSASQKNQERFGNFVYTVEDLLEKYNEPRFNRYEYISNMPVSIYKSLQKLMVEILLPSEYYEKIYIDFLRKKELQMVKQEEDQEDIIKKQSIEKRLQNLINHYNLKGKLTVSIVKNWVWEADGETAMEAVGRFQKKVFSYFNGIKDIHELNQIFQTFNEAWNYFPHQALRGKSPNQLVKELLKRYPDLRKKDSEKMPYGGKKISDDYWSMIREMEESQKPFKNWIQDSVLPEYRNYLIEEEKLSSEMVENNFQVAEIFFERAMHLGFINFNQIRPDFAKYEFPHWWQTHILDIDLDENQIWSFLKNLFRFLEAKYKINTDRFFSI